MASQFLQNLLSSLPGALQMGIDAASTPNIAFGGPTDIFRGLANAGQQQQARALSHQKLQDSIFKNNLDMANYLRMVEQMGETARHNREDERIAQENAKRQADNAGINILGNLSGWEPVPQGQEVDPSQTITIKDQTGTSHAFWKPTSDVLAERPFTGTQREAIAKEAGVKQLPVSTLLPGVGIGPGIGIGSQSLEDAGGTGGTGGIAPSTPPSDTAISDLPLIGPMGGSTRYNTTPTLIPAGYNEIANTRTRSSFLVRPSAEYQAQIDLSKKAPGSDIETTKVLIDGKYHQVDRHKLTHEIIKDYGEVPATVGVGTQEERDEIQWLKDHGNLPNTSQNRLMARDEINKHRPAPIQQPDRFYIPQEGGGYKEVSVGAGGVVPAGAVTKTGLNSLSMPTASTKSMAETAPKIVAFADRLGGENGLIAKAQAELGPAVGRWNEFMTTGVGLKNPTFKQLRLDLGLMETALIRMHVGARGGEGWLKHFQDLIGSAKDDPANLLTAMDELKWYAGVVGHLPTDGSGSGAAASGGGNNTLPGGITIDDINAEMARRKRAGGK